MTEPRLSPLFSWRSAICDSGLEPTTRHVALTLSLHMNERGGSCFPSQATLARETGLHDETVRLHLRRLREAGYLLVENDRSMKGRGTRNHYSATIPVEETTGAQTTGVEDPGAQTTTGAQTGRPPGRSTPVHRGRQVERHNDETPSEVPTEAGRLVSRLAEAVSEHQGHRPKTDAWEKPIDLLLRRGPTDWEPGPIPVEDVERMIELVFTVGAERGRDGFCWADQVRSGEALRRHWPKLHTWAKRAGKRTGNLSAVDEALAAFDAAGVEPGSTFGVAASRGPRGPVGPGDRAAPSSGQASGQSGAINGRLAL